MKTRMFFRVFFFFAIKRGQGFGSENVSATRRGMMKRERNFTIF